MQAAITGNTNIFGIILAERSAIAMEAMNYFTWFTIAFLCNIGLIVGEFNLTIVHTNDVHARFDEMSKYGGLCRTKDAQAGKCYGGVARRMTALRQIRNNTENMLFLDAGDQFQGTLWFYIHKGTAAAHFMNLLQYDAMVSHQW